MGNSSSYCRTKDGELSRPFLGGSKRTTHSILSNTLSQLAAQKESSENSGDFVKYTKMKSDFSESPRQNGHPLNGLTDRLPVSNSGMINSPKMTTITNGAATSCDKEPSTHHRCTPWSISGWRIQLKSCYRRNRHERLKSGPGVSTSKSDASGTVSPVDNRISRPRSTIGAVNQYNNHGNHTDNVQRSTLPMSHTVPELPHYLESMNELTNLKNQLNTISRLISTDSAAMPPDMQALMYPSRQSKPVLQTDSRRDLLSDLKQAHQQISELTRMLHTKDEALRQKEQENAQLQEALRKLRALFLHKDEPTSRRSAESHVPQSSRRRSPERTSGSETPHRSHDPRPYTHMSGNPVDQSKKRSRSRERMHQSTISHTRTSPAPVTPEISVKKKPLHLDAKPVTNYVKHSHHLVHK